MTPVVSYSCDYLLHLLQVSVSQASQSGFDDLGFWEKLESLRSVISCNGRKMSGLGISISVNVHTLLRTLRAGCFKPARKCPENVLITITYF